MKNSATIVMLSLLLVTFTLRAQVAINTDGSNADPSAMLDIKSDTAGILIPRMTTAQRDAINNPAQGLMVFVTDDSTFYFYKKTAWLDLSIGENGWIVSGDTVYNTTSRIGIGTSSPKAKLDIRNSTSDTGLYIQTTSNSNISYGTYSYISGDGSGPQYAATNKLDGAGTGLLIGVYNLIDNSGYGKHFGTYNALYGSGGTVQYGVRNFFGGTGTGAQVGVDNWFDNSNAYSLMGSHSTFQGEGSSSNYGSYNLFLGSGSGLICGTYNALVGSGNGIQYGVQVSVENSGDNIHYGTYSSLIGTGTGDKYGSFDSISYNAGGTHYGVYSDVVGNNNYAGYFKGRMYVSDSVGIGTDSATALLDVNGTFRLRDGSENSGYVLVSDTNGFATWQNKTTVNNSLDEAYDKGGSGMGKNITADAGAVSINGTDGFLVTGTYGSGDIIDDEITGTGTRMFFNPNSAAFRAGYIENQGWDDNFIGDYSVAMGYKTQSIGVGSCAIGYSAYAYGDYSTAFGYYCSATGSSATAFGNETRASGAYSSAFGQLSHATATYSVASGLSSTASGVASTALGWYSVASGSRSTAMGVYTTAPSEIETALGSYNTDYTPVSATSWNNSDRLFVIGNGVDENNKSNALTIYKDGKMNINDEYFMPQTDGTSGQVMQTNGAGQVSFVDPPNVSGWTVSGNYVYNLTSSIGIGLLLPGAKLAINDTTTPTAFSISNGYNDNNIHYGIYNNLTGVGTGKQYGSFTIINNTSSQSHFGSYCKLTGTGSGAKYGFYAYMASSTGGNHYGVYSYAPGSTNYAGYFNGRLYASDKVGIGVLTPGAKLDVAGHIWQTSTGYSVFLGENAGASDDLSNNNNVLVGYNAGTANTSGYSNTALGYKAMEAVTDGAWNTALGHLAYQTGNYSNSTALGDGVSITASGQVRIGHNVGSIGGPQSWTNTSDGRFKFDVKENVPGIEFIKKLRPVTYHLDVDKLDRYTSVSDEYRQNPVAKQAALKSTTQLRTGFIAQEVEKAAQSVGYNFSGVDAPKNSKDVYGLRYAEFVVPLVKAVQEQQQTIEQQQKTINDLSKRLEYLEKMMDNN